MCITSRMISNVENEICDDFCIKYDWLMKGFSFSMNILAFWQIEIIHGPNLNQQQKEYEVKI
jgi:hypothetical protein